MYDLTSCFFPPKAISHERHCEEPVEIPRPSLRAPKERSNLAGSGQAPQSAVLTCLPARQGLLRLRFDRCLAMTSFGEVAA